MPVTVRNTDILFNDNSTLSSNPLPAGTVLLFAQTNAPTGWTKNTSDGNNHALRVVTGTASSGGSVDFTTAFASQAVTGTVSVSGSAGATTLTTPQIPAHRHPIQTVSPAPYGFRNFPASMRVYAPSGPVGNSSQPTTHPASPGGNAMNTTGGDGSHTHPLSISSSSFSGNAINLAVRYIDVIRATKN